MILLQIYQWVCQWKNFENRLTLGEVMGKSLVSCFFETQCSMHTAFNSTRPTCRLTSSLQPASLLHYWLSDLIDRNIGVVGGNCHPPPSWPSGSRPVRRPHAKFGVGTVGSLITVVVRISLHKDSLIHCVLKRFGDSVHRTVARNVWFLQTYTCQCKFM